MIRILLVPTSDFLGHPFPQRHNHIFERLGRHGDFEVHVVRFKLFERARLHTDLTIHELGSQSSKGVAQYYLVNALDHANQIRRIVRQEKIDLLVLSNIAAPFAYTFMDRISSLHAQIVVDLPDYFPTSAAGYLFDVNKTSGKMFAGLLDLPLRYMIRRASLVTVASHALAGYAKNAGACKVALVPNGISENFFTLADGGKIRKKLGFADEDLIIGYVGSIEFWLDMKCLIDAIARVKKKLPAKLLIIGKQLQTNYSRMVSQWINRAGIEEQTTWLDFVPHQQVPEYMAGLSIGAIPFDINNPTAFYAAPNKMWEYLSQSRPVIATPIPEIVRDSEAVFLASNPDEWVSSIELITREPEITTRKTEIGRKKALTRTWDKSAETLATELDKLNASANKRP